MLASLCLLFLLSSRASAAADFAAQISVISSRAANGILSSRFTGSQNLPDLKKGYEISVTHDTKPCNKFQDTFFSVQLKAPRSATARYELFTDEKTWSEASDLCSKAGFLLAEPPESAESLRALQCVVTRGISVAAITKKYVALDFRYDDQRKDFVTSAGKVLNSTTVTPWAPHNPHTGHKGARENCGAMDEQGRLHDVRCDVRMPYVCQIP